MVWLIWVVAACMVGNALRLRRRLTGLRRLPTAHGQASQSYDWVLAEGVVVPPEVRRAAVAHARERGLGMLDLVPADLPVDQALDLAKHLDFRAYRRDPYGMGRGAGYALLADRDALQRSGLRAGTDLDPAELGAATTRLKFYAGTADLVVADIPAADRVRERRAFVRSLMLAAPDALALPQTLGAALAGYALVLAALVSAPAQGLALAVLYCALPCLVFAGTAITPRDLPRFAAFRLVHTPLSIWRTLRAPRTRWEHDLVARREEARGWYRAQIDEGVERFLGPRRADCPWCGSTRLTRHVLTRDILQGKPGRFRLERCLGCRHIFQNPRLTPEGLGFYYKDMYDGLGDRLAERTLSSNTPWYQARARMVGRVTEPRSWLDVGTGKAHFCRVARDVLPGTVFDGLDLGAGVAEAVARGWVGQGFQGEFLDLADDLAGHYDVISMHHYLEHTTDPHAELDAAAKVLQPGGHLLIELPDPESWFGSVLRSFWVPWLAPQHLHMIPIGNLKDALALRGLKVVAQERREARQGPDITTAAAAVVNWLGLDVDRPWTAHPPGVPAYVRVLAIQLVAAPLVGLGIVLDLLTVPFIRGRTNAYRVLARKQGG